MKAVLVLLIITWFQHSTLGDCTGHFIPKRPSIWRPPIDSNHCKSTKLLLNQVLHTVKQNSQHLKNLETKLKEGALFDRKHADSNYDDSVESLFGGSDIGYGGIAVRSGPDDDSEGDDGGEDDAESDDDESEGDDDASEDNTESTTKGKKSDKSDKKSKSKKSEKK